jgi:NAD(P)-dependent dehydrogenase (short-subunit alcohol dehydrogenase family)
MTQTVLITGCSSGLGRSLAGLFASRGWNVVATMRQPNPSVGFESQRNVLVCRLDVTDTSSIHAAIDSGISAFGGIDALINNAGYGLFGVFEGTSSAKIREQFAVNVFGVMETIRGILPHFRAKRSGVIANVSSGAGIYGLPAFSLYCASKFALEGFSEALSYELAAQGVRVKIIEPGGIVSTGFAKRSALEAASNPPRADYDEFMKRTADSFAKQSAVRRDTELQVSECIYKAVTDGSDQLRYVATEDIKRFVRARRETCEAKFIRLMRSRFAGLSKR